MDKKLFAELVESMTESGEIARGERAPSREFRVGETDVKRIAGRRVCRRREKGVRDNFDDGNYEATPRA